MVDDSTWAVLLKVGCVLVDLEVVAILLNRAGLSAFSKLDQMAEQFEVLGFQLILCKLSQ